MPRHGGWESTGFAARLKAIRAAVGISQRELAEQIDVAEMTLARLERGEHEPAWPLVLRLADALGVGVEEFRPPATREMDV